MAYLIWCIAYANIEILEMLHGQRVISRQGISDCSHKRVCKTGLQDERARLQVNRSSQRHQVKLLTASAQVCLFLVNSRHELLESLSSQDKTYLARVL